MNNHSKALKSNDSGCRSTLSGCLVTTLLFPICLMVCFWLAIAIGPLGCSHPNTCTQSQKNVKGVLSIILMFGGGFGVPIATGIAVGKIVRNGAVNHSQPPQDQMP